MDRVFIRGLQVEAQIGCLEWEHTIRRKLKISVDFMLDLSDVSDGQLEHSVDYVEARAYIMRYFDDQRPAMIETAARELAHGLAERFKTVSSLRLQIEKPGAVPDIDTLGVEYHWSRDA